MNRTRIENNCCLFIDTLDFDQIRDLSCKNTDISYWANDQAITVFDDEFKIYTAPIWIAAHFSQTLSKCCPATMMPITRNCFNFCINKKQINRYLLIKLVEWFGFKNYDYTWSGIGKQFDMQGVIAEWNSTHIPILDDETKTFLLAPITHEKKFLCKDKTVGNDVALPTSNNLANWNDGLSKMFEHSAVSLISESVQFQKIAIITEKTIFAILGRTIPIWVGGFGIPHAMKQIGFDIFDDIIDHGYQFKPTLIERCFYSISLNQQILSDITMAQKLRISHHDRLDRNLKLLQSGILDSYCGRIIDSYPTSVKNIMMSRWKELV